MCPAARNVDDGTTTGLKHGRDFVLHRQQHAADVEVAHLMVVLDRLLGCERAEPALGAGVVEGNVQAPKAPRFFSTSAMMSSSRVTSVCTNKALPPFEVIPRTTCSPSAMRRLETTTFAPSLANARAVALPMRRCLR